MAFLCPQNQYFLLSCRASGASLWVLGFMTSENRQKKEKKEPALMAKLVKALAVLALHPKFNPQNPYNGGKREPTDLRTHCGAYAHAHTS